MLRIQKRITDADGKPHWEFTPASIADVAVDDILNFTCGLTIGRRRGDHYIVEVFVTKINRKTIAATERKGSYSPGTLWRLHYDDPAFIIDIDRWSGRKGDRTMNAQDKPLSADAIINDVDPDDTDVINDNINDDDIDDDDIDDPE